MSWKILVLTSHRPTSWHLFVPCLRPLHFFFLRSSIVLTNMLRLNQAARLPPYGEEISLIKLCVKSVFERITRKSNDIFWVKENWGYNPIIRKLRRRTGL